MKSDLYIQSSNSLRLSALRDCRYALVVYTVYLLQFGEVEGKAQSRSRHHWPERRRRAQWRFSTHARGRSAWNVRWNFQLASNIMRERVVATCRRLGYWT